MDHNHKCDSDDIAIKSYFLGPQSENADWVLKQLNSFFSDWFHWRTRTFTADGGSISVADQRSYSFQNAQKKISDNLRELSAIFQNETPRYSPRYIGHMVSEISLPGVLGHFLTLLYNPNNISRESSIVGIRIEREALELLAEMFNIQSEKAVGHFTSGGTIANYEALLRAKARVERWITLGLFQKKYLGSLRSFYQSTVMGWSNYYQAISGSRWTCDFIEYQESILQSPRRLANEIRENFGIQYDGPIFCVPESKHYSWPKGMRLLGLGKENLIEVKTNLNGRMDVNHLREVLLEAKTREWPIGMVITVAGTTEMGTVDPIHRVQDLLDSESFGSGNIWHHVDAAYGGFFASLAKNSGLLRPDVAEAFAGISRVSSITIDPHKLGYVPYASGCVIVTDKANYKFQEVDAPYIDFDLEGDPGLQTIEGSRSAAGAVSTWLTGKTLGFHPEGFGRVLGKTLNAKSNMEAALLSLAPHICLAYGLDTNIIAFMFKASSGLLSESNLTTIKFLKFVADSDSPFYVSKTSLDPKRSSVASWANDNGLVVDHKNIEFVRLTLMNPFLISKELKVDLVEQFVGRVKEYINGRICEQSTSR